MEDIALVIELKLQILEGKLEPKQNMNVFQIEFYIQIEVGNFKVRLFDRRPAGSPFLGVFFYVDYLLRLSHQFIIRGLTQR